MTLGNLVALTQDNVKRMLAYSSIAHTGYMLVGLAAWAGEPGRDDGIEGAALLRRRLHVHEPRRVRGHRGAPEADRRHVQRSATFAGLGRREPLLGVLMTLFLLSLTGIPPTAGFFAKAFVILAAVEAGGPLSVLAVIAVLNAAVAAFYYLRVVVYMYMRDPAERRPGAAPRRAAVGRARGRDRADDRRSACSRRRCSRIVGRRGQLDRADPCAG